MLLKKNESKKNDIHEIKMKKNYNIIVQKKIFKK